MQLTKVGEAIVARAHEDTELFTPYGEVTGIFKDIAPPGLQDSYPYILFNIITADNVDGFSFALRRLVVRFSIFTRLEAGGPTRSFLADRVKGDWLTAENRAPTYGFERHALELTGDWTASPMKFVQEWEDTDGVITQTMIEFELYISRAATNP